MQIQLTFNDFDEMEAFCQRAIQDKAITSTKPAKKPTPVKEEVTEPVKEETPVKEEVA